MKSMEQLDARAFPRQSAVAGNKGRQGFPNSFIASNLITRQRAGVATQCRQEGAVAGRIAQYVSPIVTNAFAARPSKTIVL